MRNTDAKDMFSTEKKAVKHELAPQVLKEVDLLPDRELKQFMQAHLPCVTQPKISKVSHVRGKYRIYTPADKKLILWLRYGKHKPKPGVDLPVMTIAQVSRLMSCAESTMHK